MRPLGRSLEIGFWRLLALACLLLAPSAPALALSAAVPLKDFKHTVWLAKDGLPSDTLLAMQQTADGFLWIASHGGVFRFDGEHFERVPLPRDPKLTSASAYSLHASRDGGLWIGFTFGGVGLLAAGKLKMYDAQDGLPQGSVRMIAETASGMVWVVTSSGIAFLDGSGRWQAVAVGDAPLGSIRILTFDSAGGIWAASRTRIYRRSPGATSFQAFPLASGLLTDVVAEGGGTVWMTDDTAVRRVAAGLPGSADASLPGNLGRIDSEGCLWTMDGADMVRIPLRTASDTLELAAVRDRVRPADGLAWSGLNFQFLETRDGQMWLLGTGSLERFSTRAVTPFDTTFLSRNEAQQLGLGKPPDAGLWVIPGGGTVRRVDSGQASIVPGLSDVGVIARVADGTTWAGGSDRFWHSGASGWSAVDRPDGTEGFDAQAFAGKGLDDVWVSVIRKGVFHRSGGAWHAYGDLPDLPRQPAVTMAWGPLGNLWLGYTDGRIARVNGSIVKMFGSADGLDIGVITALVADGDTVWAGGEFGLRRWNGHAFAPLHADRDRAFDYITGIVPTASGDVWIHSAAGIVRVPARDIAASIDTRTQVVVDVLDRLDGYDGSSGRVRPLPTAIQGNDDRLWFASTAGIFSIDPTLSLRPRSPPVTFIKSLVANGAAQPLQSPLVLEKGTREVRIDFVGLDLEVAERVRYRYRLDGVDPDWRDVGMQRQAFYTNLGAGSYNFHVVSSNDGRIWSPQEAALSFRIAPTFTQSLWFVALCFAASIGFIAVLLRWRVRQEARQLRWKLDAQFAERERIARELHDTLLQSTQGLILRFQAITNHMPKADGNRQKMESALERADEVLTEGRDRVRGLRHSSERRASLFDTLRALGSELCMEARITFRCECAGTEPLLSPEIADEIRQIVGEALVNACRHGQARSIDLRIDRFPTELTMLIDDDGVGIGAGTATSGSRPGHWGMRGMQERSERIGARLKIEPRAEGGTRVQLVVPLKRVVLT